MNIGKHIEKENLHHAYLFEGEREEVLGELVTFTKDAEVVDMKFDAFKMDDARTLKSYTSEKSFKEQRRIFVISANSFLLEAQNALLKIFEEPIENTHFFVIVPDTNALLQTFVSRFYVISPRQGLGVDTVDAEKFLKMSGSARVDFIKELLQEPEEEDEEGNEIIVINSARAKAINFLNSLEVVLHSFLIKNFSNVTPLSFEHIFKVRKYLRMPGSSAKSLMESVALIVPIFS